MCADTRPVGGAKQSGPSRRSRWLLLGFLAPLVAVAVVAGGIGVARHHGGWGWWATPSAAPSIIEFEDRDYDRGGEQRGGIPSGYVLGGETPGGGQIYKSVLDRGTSIVILVKDGQHVYVYGLMGGP